MPKYEVTFDVNRADGTYTFGVEAYSKEDAIKKCCDIGELIREDFVLDWNRDYGDEPDAVVEEVDEFDRDYALDLANKHSAREALFEKILKEHVVLSELRNIYRQRWKDGCCE